MSLNLWKLLNGVAVVTLAFGGSLALKSDECFGGSDNASYLDWVAESGSSYNASVCYDALSKDATQGIAFHWKVDDENVYIAVAARATGWVGLGLAETGGMKGSDMVIFETANPGQLRDAHVLDEPLPITDECQDWVFVNSHSEGGFLIFEGYRKLRTGDTQDHDIFDDIDSSIAAQRIVAAWGESTSASFHGLNRAQGNVRWYGGGDEVELVVKWLETASDGYFELFAPNYTIKAIETNYVNFCFSWNDIVMQGVPANQSVTALAAVVVSHDESRAFVHHASAFASMQVANLSECLPSTAYNYPVFSWTPGVLPLVLPDDVGLTMGPGYGVQSFLIEVHYNNPELVENIVDSGGLRVYYSLTPRKHEMGGFVLGDPAGGLYGEPISPGLSQYEYVCNSACSSFSLTEPVTVLQEYFHMHREGYAATTYQIRDSEVIREAHIDFFDFDQAGTPLVRQKPFTINPGDSFISSFYFNSKNGTKFGKSSHEEMSFQVLLYYPAVRILDTFPWICSYDLPVASCNATVQMRLLEPNDPVERVFGPAPLNCSEKASVKEKTSSSTFIGASWLHIAGFWLHVAVALQLIEL